MKLKLKKLVFMAPILDMPNEASSTKGMLFDSKEHDVLESNNGYHKVEKGWIHENYVDVIGGDENVFNIYPENISIDYDTSRKTVGEVQEAMEEHLSMKNQNKVRVHLHQEVPISDEIKEVLKTHGIYERKDLLYKYETFKRFSVLDPYDKIHMAREYLFFTKPDLNIYSNSGGTSLNPELAGNPIFRGIHQVNPNILYQLQKSVTVNSSNFMNRLSWSVKNTMDMPSISSDEIETNSNQFGTKMYYRTHSIKSGENHDFTLEFSDSKSLPMYLTFKAWDEYSTLKALGIVSPKDLYRDNQERHDCISIFKFIVLENGMDILYYAKAIGCYPKEAPRESFSEVTEGLTHNVSFKAFDIDDMNPLIIDEFNDLSLAGEDLPLFDQELGRPSGEFPRSAYVIKHGKRFRLKWRR